MNLWVVFLTGLTIGGLTCLAVQGGLLASTIAAREEDDLEEGSHRKHTILLTLAFLATKLAAYTVLGALLGTFGKALSINPNIQLTVQFIAGLYMIAIALDLLNIHPIFRYAVIQPPRFLTRMIRNQAKSKDLFAPALLGAMTVFIPCGTTLAMEALSVTSGNPLLGAATMFLFVLGTTPLFLGIGWITTILGDNFRQKFLKLAALAVLYLGITSANGSLVAIGSPITIQALTDNIPITIDLSGGSQSVDNNLAQLVDGYQMASINVLPNGYNPSFIQVRSSIPVVLNLSNSGNLGCTSVFRIPQLGITQMLTSGGFDKIEFTPSFRGKLTYTCGMGMYRGVIEVI